MDSVVILAPAIYSIGKFAELLAKSGAFQPSDAGTIVIESDSKSRIYLYEEKDLTCLNEDEWYCSLALKYYFAETLDSRLFILNYASVPFAQQVLLAIVDDERMIVDNGFGTVLPGKEFIQKLKSSLGWNWRNDIPKKNLDAEIG